MTTFQIFLLINYVLCLLIVLQMVFFSKKKPERIVAWTLFLVFPFVGLFFYCLVGGGLNRMSKTMIKRKQLSSAEYNRHIKKQIEEIEKNKETNDYPEEVRDLILLNLNNSDSIYTQNNSIEYFCDGGSVFDKMMEDIKNAQSTIHIEFYIFANDKTGKKMKNLLIEKAKQGVEIRLLYDSIGSLRTRKRMFRKLKKAGGMIAEFFPPFMNIKFLNVNANYRNHRKVVVIDGKIGYAGGINIRDDHMGLSKKLSPWRDTHVRIVGGAVSSLQNIFLSDWRYSIADKNKVDYYLNEKYFPVAPKDSGDIGMQVLSSGPENSNEAIKECIIKMIVSAKKRIRIQTPYFIPDDTFIGSIKLAVLSGVEVEIIVPKKIDHWHVHYASLSYLNDMLSLGVKIYEYQGFIHSKAVLVDDEILTLGSCNIDIRSFSLNFEDNVVIYDKDKVVEYSKIYDKDLENCVRYTEQSRKKKNIFVKIMISLCRLFSAIL